MQFTFKLAGLYQRLHNSVYIMQKIIEIKFRMSYFHTAAFYAAHFQDIIDQGQKVFRRSINIIQTFRNLSSSRVVFFGNGRHAHYGVHRRADLVTDSRQEFAFGLAGLPSRIQSIAELQVFGFLVSDYFRNIRPGHYIHLMICVISHESRFGHASTAVIPDHAGCEHISAIPFTWDMTVSGWQFSINN